MTPVVAALAAIACALVLGGGAAGAGTSPSPPNAFDRTTSAPLAVVAVVERREPPAGRIDPYRLRVTETVAGSAPDGLRVVSERFFPSDPPALGEGKTYLLFLGAVPTQSSWRAFQGDPKVRHLASTGDVRELAPSSVGPVVSALRDFARSVNDDPTGSRRLDLLLAGLTSGPEPLRGDAALAIAARPAPLTAWLDEGKLGRVAAWLADPGQDGPLQSRLVDALAKGRAARPGTALLDAGRANPRLRPTVLDYFVRVTSNDEATRAVALQALAEWRSATDAETRIVLFVLAAQLGGGESVGFLTDAAIGDASDDAAVSAVSALAGLGRDEAHAEATYAGLGRIAREARDRPASRAIEALALTGTARGVVEITSVFGRHRAELEIVAVMALLNANHPDAFAVIRRLREAPDTDPRVRQAIDKITGTRG